MQNKVLSVQQPYATLICAGVKKVENRTWKTDYRGKLLIHASGDSHAYPDLDCLPDSFVQKAIDYSNGKATASDAVINYDKLLDRAYSFYGQNSKDNQPPQDWLKDAVKKYGFFMPNQTIIGEVTLSDIVDNLYDADDDFAEPGCFYWKMTNPVFYDKPITNVMGRLRLWNFET
jgi:hypothetical protein